MVSYKSLRCSCIRWLAPWKLIWGTPTMMALYRDCRKSQSVVNLNFSPFKHGVWGDSAGKVEYWFSSCLRIKYVHSPPKFGQADHHTSASRPLPTDHDGVARYCRKDQDR